MTARVKQAIHASTTGDFAVQVHAAARQVWCSKSTLPESFTISRQIAFHLPQVLSLLLHNYPIVLKLCMHW